MFLCGTERVKSKIVKVIETINEIFKGNTRVWSEKYIGPHSSSFFQNPDTGVVPRNFI